MARVELYIYDLAQGMASQFSGLVGFQLDGIWHTAIVVYGREWFFGSGGLEQTLPGTTMLGQPLRKVDLGTTNVSYEAFRAHLDQVGRGRFAGHTYRLLEHNCNNFSEEIARFLSGGTRGIPEYILELPIKVRNSPIAALLAPIIENATPHGQNLEEGFSGGDRAASAASPTPTSSYKHFPHTTYLDYPQAVEIDKLMGKLREFITKHGDDITEDNVFGLLSLLNGQSSLEGVAWATAKKILTSWPSEDVFPVLDALRWVVGQKPVTAQIAEELLKLLLARIRTDSNPTNIQLSLKVLSNYFKHDSMRPLVVKERESLVSRMNGLVEEMEDMANVLQIAISTLALNLSISLLAEPDQEASFQIVSALASNYLPTFKNAEALYRTTVALGTLVVKDREAKDLALALDSVRALKIVDKSVSQKVKESVEECLKVLES